MIDFATYRETLAGCLHRHAEKLMEISGSHFEPNGLQARAQGIKARELFVWSRAELATANTGRDFSTQRVSKEEVGLAINFAEAEVDKLSSLVTVELERILGPLAEARHLERHVENSLPTELNEVFRCKAEYDKALFYLRLALRLS